MKNIRSITIFIFTISSVYLLIYLLSGTTSIAIAISTIASTVPFLINRGRAASSSRKKDAAWPEAIDGVVSALQSGMSISEAICSLSNRGPEILRDDFRIIESELLHGGEFGEILLRAKDNADSAIADQVFETLILAKEFGGRDTNSALRLLAEFVREDLAVSEEIRTKFGWIKNSAILATIAPWLLLLLLSSQKSTRESFSTIAGMQILALGVVLTGIAFVWMQRVGKLPQMERALR